MTWIKSWSLPERLSSLPRADALRVFMERLREARGDELSFVILFGSMARGDWGRHSDCDILIGLRDDGRTRLMDRLLEFAVFSPGGIEPIAYYPSEVERMFLSFNQLLLNALVDGVPLFDAGIWQAYRDRLDRLIREGHVERVPRGWHWTAEAESVVASRADASRWRP